MNQYDQPTNLWGSHSPLMSFTGLALIVTASCRLSSSVVVLLLLTGIYAVTLSIIFFGKSIIPTKYKTALIIMILTFVSSLFYLAMEMINPVSALESHFIVLLIPVVFLGSRIVQRAEQFSPLEGILFGIKEASILGGIIMMISLIREPLAYGTLSVPFVGKIVNLLSDPMKERVVLHVFASPLGGFLLTACCIVFVRLASFQQSSHVKTEDNND
jgi:hypothetical protein